MQFPVKLTEEQMKTAFLEEAGSNGDIYVYKMLTCSICMESITAVKGVNVNCGHAFHAECIVPWLQRDRRCPVCRHAPKSRKQEAVTETAALDSADEETS